MKEEYKNPYTSYENISTLPSIVASLDILGYQNFIRSKYPKKTLNRKLRLLRLCVENSYKYVRDTRVPAVIDCQKFWETRAYSDNISICYPIRSDQITCPGYPKCSDNIILALFHVLFLLSHFQLEMIRTGGFFVRGAIAVGEAFVDNNIIFGDALLEAHNTEQKVAIDPRIILAPSSIKVVKDYLCNNRNGDEFNYLAELSKDADGVYFVDYLNFLKLEGDFSKEEYLKVHKRRVSKKMRLFNCDPKILRKYQWVANYHNEYCVQHSIDDSEFTIESTTIHKGRIVDKDE